MPASLPPADRRLPPDRNSASFNTKDRCREASPERCSSYRDGKGDIPTSSHATLSTTSLVPCFTMHTVSVRKHAVVSVSGISLRVDIASVLTFDQSVGVNNFSGNLCTT